MRKKQSAVLEKYFDEIRDKIIKGIKSNGTEKAEQAKRELEYPFRRNTFPHHPDGQDNF